MMADGVELPPWKASVPLGTAFAPLPLLQVRDIAPREAVERLKKFEKIHAEFERKMREYSIGEGQGTALLPCQWHTIAVYDLWHIV